MTGAIGNILSGTAQKQLFALQKTARTVDSVQLQLATGRRVNSAIDNPQNFFTARSLNNRASDLSALLDGIGQSIRTVQVAAHGVEAIERLLVQGEAVALDKEAKLENGEAIGSNYDVIIDNSPPPLSTQILADAPVGYWRLNETAGGTAVNLGSGGASIDGIYQNGAAQGATTLYNNGGDVSVDFDGINDRIRIPNSPLINTAASTPERTVELVFNADTVAGRQVLYEEGATVNGLTIYIDNGNIHVTGEDDQGAQRWADANINAPIVAGQTYHIAFVFDLPNNSFTGYLDGVDIGSVGVANGTFPSHSGGIGIGRVNGGVQFHDGESGGSGFAFDGRISDVALYNRALANSELLSHATSLNASTSTQVHNSEFQGIWEQIDRVSIDAHYRGINLLKGDNLVTHFNEEGRSILTTEGVDFTVGAFGITDHDFDDLTDVRLIIANIRIAIEQVRRFGTRLSNDLGIIQTREDFTRGTINTLKAGSDDLTLADQNEAGANLLALQTRESLAMTALSIGANQAQGILTIFS